MAGVIQSDIADALGEHRADRKQQMGEKPLKLELGRNDRRAAESTQSQATETLELTLQLGAELEKFQPRHNQPISILLLTALNILLHRYTGEEEITVGSLIAQEAVALRTAFTNNPSGSEAIRRVAQTVAAAKQRTPLHPDANPETAPRLSVMFVPAFGDNVPEEAAVGECDLMWIATGADNQIRLQCQYNTTVYDAASIQQILGHFQTLLTGLIAQPQQPIGTLPLLSQKERHQLLVEWNQTQQEYPQDQCIHQLFEKQVEQRPQAVAAVFETQQLTYRELNQKANQVAHSLQKRGVGPEVLVGICVDRSLEMLIGLLGILKAGGAYVPLDPAYPGERLAYMLQDADVRVVLTTAALVPHLQERIISPTNIQWLCLDRHWAEISQESSSNPTSQVQPENLAYTIYTSGSTGQPKGVQIPHRAVVNFLTAMSRRPGLSPQDILLAVTTISFDIAGLELYLPLSVGAQVAIARREVTSSGPILAKLIKDSGATVMQATPATWYLLLASGWQGKPGLKILCGGEALPQDLADRLLELEAELWNMYGPTETTIWSTVCAVGSCRRSPESKDDLSYLTPNAPESVGTPIANTQIYILDQHLQPVPLGISGELYIGGDGLARGYRNRPDLTEERFIPNPFGEGRIYKTGDLARYLPNGHIEFKGRSDHQVKLRGFRIEAGEIETILNRHQSVRQSVVTVRDARLASSADALRPGGLAEAEKRLVAYVVPESDANSRAAIDQSDQQREQIAQWQQLWDLAYRQETNSADPTFNISGWNDSYSGAPIPASEMREWLEGTVGRILSYHPQRVLEIGCGTGMLLFRIAPHCQSYCGIDLAPTALQYIEARLLHLEGDWSGVKLRQGDAMEAFAGVGAGEFDTIVINSVVQLFPNIDYLVKVLEKAVKLVAPSGRIFIGDVRNLELLEAFHASVQLHKAPDGLSMAQLRSLVKKSIMQERQMAIAPDFFVALKHHLREISHVETQLRRGYARNELSKFRYDAILHINKDDVPAPAPLRLDWDADKLSLAQVRSLLQNSQPEILEITGVPNARLAVEVKLLEELDALSIGELRQTLQQLDSEGIEPEAWWQLSAEVPYEIAVRGSRSRPYTYDVRCQKGQPRAIWCYSTGEEGTKALSAYANNPIQGQIASQLEPELRRYLQAKLPDYMVPSAFVFLAQMPLTPNGKIDRQALPEPERSRPQLATALVLPQQDSERAIARVWQEILQLEEVGIQDNFFDLGGNSLLLAMVHSRLQIQFGSDLSIVSLFQYPTIQALAQYLTQSPQPQPAAPHPDTTSRRSRRTTVKDISERRQQHRRGN